MVGIQTAKAWRGRAATIVATLFALAACGGDDARDADPLPLRVKVSGTVMREQALAGGVEAKPAGGVPTSVASARAGRYELIVEQMRPPFVLINSASGPLLSVATGAGIANVTPLTHLVVAELQGERPEAFYEVLGPLGGNDFSRITPGLVAAAEARVRARLHRRFGLAVPASIESFLTTPFEAVPGDAMHDLIVALQAGLAAQGLAFDDLVQEVVVQSRHCAIESLALEVAGVADVLCPAAKESATDADDAGITVHTFTSGLNDRLVLREQADAVLSVTFERDGSPVAACEAAACIGITLGTRAGDAARQIDFAGTRLAGSGQAAAEVVLTGSLVAGNGEVAPGCAGARITVDYASGAQEVECVARRISTPRFARVSHAFFGKVDSLRVLDVRADGDTVVWVSLARNVTEIEYRCKGSDCQDVTLGPPDAQGLRRVRLEGTVLQRALGGGQVDAADTATVRAELLAAPLPRVGSSACAQPISLVITSSDGTVLPHCDPRPGSSVGFDDADGDGVFESVLTTSDSIAGDFAEASFNLALGTANRVALRRSFLSGGEPGYLCAAPGCDGVSATRTADGRYVFRFQGTQLTEVDPDGGLGERSVRFDGTLLSGSFGLGGD